MIALQNQTCQPIELRIAQDLNRSAIDAETQALNFFPILGLRAFDEIYPNADLRNGGNLTRGWALKSHTFEDFEGWICNGRIKWLGGAPHRDDRGKIIRYFSQHKAKSPITFIEPSQRAIALAELRYGIQKPADLTYWEWVINKGLPVIIIEGEKKAASLICAGLPAISIPGIYTGYTCDRDEWNRTIGKHLRDELKLVDTRRNVAILFDWREGNYCESPEYRAAVSLARQFDKADVRIAIMSGPFKGADDAIAAGRLDIVENSLIKARTATALEHERLWLGYRLFDEYGQKHDNTFFDPSEPQDGEILIAKSPPNSGKTEWFAQNVAKVKKAGDRVAATAKGFMASFGHRNALQEQLCERWDFNHLDIHNAYQLFGDPNLRVALCFDSILKLPIELWDAPSITLVIDESVTAIKHLLTSSTLAGKRLQILERFEYIIKRCSRIIFMDANNPDWLIKYVASLCSDKKIITYENRSDRPAPPMYFVDDSAVKRNRASEWFGRQILNADLPAVLTDSIVKAEALADRLQKLKGDGILLTSKTVTEKWARQFLKNPDAYIDADPDRVNWFVATPTVESGVSIESEHLKSCFCFFTGTVGINEAVQMSRRIRNAEQIIVYAPTKGIVNNRNSGAFEKMILENLQHKIEVEASLFSDKSLHDQVVENIRSQADSPHVKAWATIQAIDYLERQNYRHFLQLAFVQMGFNPVQIEAKDIQSTDLKAAKLEVQMAECTQIFNAPDIDRETADRLSKKLDANWQERCKIIKFGICDRLPGIRDSELWSVEFIHRVRYSERNLIVWLENYWMLKHPEEVKQLQQQKWNKLQTQFDRFIPDMGDRYLKIEVLRKLNVEFFLTGDRYSARTPEVGNFHAKIKRSPTIYSVLGHPGKDTPLQYLSRAILPRLFGIRPTYKQVRDTTLTGLVEDNRINTYACDRAAFPANWDELLEFVDRRYSQQIVQLHYGIEQPQTLTVEEVNIVCCDIIYQDEKKTLPQDDTFLSEKEGEQLEGCQGEGFGAIAPEIEERGEEGRSTQSEGAIEQNQGAIGEVAGAIGAETAKIAADCGVTAWVNLFGEVFQGVIVSIARNTARFLVNGEIWLVAASELLYQPPAPE